jgi:hypothetical protein
MIITDTNQKETTNVDNQCRIMTEQARVPLAHRKWEPHVAEIKRTMDIRPR